MNALTKIVFLTIGCLFFSIGGYAQKGHSPKKDSIQSPNSVYMKVDRSPEYPGGEAEMVHFILKNAHLPTSTAEAPVTGKVLVEFIVEKDGSLSNIKVIKGVGQRYDQECTRLFEIMPKWAPGKIGSHKVRTLMMIPITIS